MSMRRQLTSGFTLIELMVVVVLVSVLMLVAVPSFISFKRNSELTAAANNYVGMLSVARGEAMKRSVTTMVVPLTGTDWRTGWTVFVDANSSGTFDTGDTVISTNSDPLPSYFSVTKTGSATNSGNAARYNGSGYSMAVTGSGFDVSTIQVRRTDVSGAEQLKQTRRVKISSTGRTRVCTPTSEDSDDNCRATID